MHCEASSPGSTALKPQAPKRGREVSDDGAPDGFWAALAARLLHPIQVQIIEAMAWIDLPVSASDLVNVFSREERLSAIAYHVRRLDSLGALAPAGKRHPVRGSEEKLHRLGYY
jgi:hypothetical protein